MNLSPRKARTVSAVGFILSLFIFVFMLIFGAITQVLAIFILSWHVFVGLLVWLVLLIQFYQRTLAEQEKLDMIQLSNSSQGGTIFSGDGNRMAMLAVAQKRSAFLEKWILPISAVVIGVFQVLMGLWLLRGFVLNESRLMQDWSAPTHLFLGAVLLAAISFICFLFSRFATGMSVETLWKPLRAGGSYLLATAIFGFALAVAMVFAQYKYTLGTTLLNYVLPVLIVVLGVETLLNAVLDIYRPRVAGQYSRAAFDSRILGLINEPGGILHTVAHTIDYQFGFKVSQTWFYKLIEKAILPLVLFALLVLYLMSSFVVIGPGQAGVIERNGVPVREAGMDSPIRTIKPGLHVKLPWPIEKAYVYPTDQIQQFSIGYEAGEEDLDKKALLWGEKHYEKEYNLLVAVQKDSSEGEDFAGVVPVSIVQANVPMLYRISDISKYIYNHKDPRELLDAICYRELTRYAASAKVEMDDASPVNPESKKSLLGAGRMEAAEELQRRIQDAADKAELGVEIVLLGLQGVHPPAEVAKAYEDVVASVQEKQAIVLLAQAEKNRILTELGGSIAEVDALYNLALEFERSKERGDAQKTEELETQLQTAFVNVKGTVFRILREAESYAFEQINLIKGEGIRFNGQEQAYRASPEIYMKLQRLMTLEEGLQDVRKYVVVVDKEDAQVYIVDLQEKLTQSLYDMDLGLDEN